jgi:hypothetical protein
MEYVLREVRTRPTKYENFGRKWRVTVWVPLYTVGGMLYTHVRYFLYARLVVLLRQITDEITDLGQCVWQWIQVHSSMNTDPKAYVLKLSLSTEWWSQCQHCQLSGAREHLARKCATGSENTMANENQMSNRPASFTYRYGVGDGWYNSSVGRRDWETTARRWRRSRCAHCACPNSVRYNYVSEK